MGNWKVKREGYFSDEKKCKGSRKSVLADIE
jgi:hypothetical protein